MSWLSSPGVKFGDEMISKFVQIEGDWLQEGLCCLLCEENEGEHGSTQALNE